MGLVTEATQEAIMKDRTTGREIILGVDTHRDVHVAAVIDSAGQLLGTHSVPTTTDGYTRLLTWTSSLGLLRCAGVEGTGTYGAGLTRVLRNHGIVVFEVNRPDRSQRRLKGKSEPPRVLRRLQLLREWSHEQVKTAVGNLFPH